MTVDEAGGVLAWLRRQGADVSLDAERNLRVSLDSVVWIRDHETADAIARLVLSLRDEIREQLIAERECDGCAVSEYSASVDVH
jgi:hypothetical protein